MNALFPLFAVLIWSINIVVNKLSTALIEPAAIAFYRWLLAFLLLTPFMLPGVVRHLAVIRRHALKLLALGLLGIVLYQCLAYYAAQTISALMMGILGSLLPMLTMLISIPLLRVKPGRGLLFGGLLSLCGIVWLISGGHPQDILRQGIGRGEAMIFVGACAYALYGVLLKRWAIPLPGWLSLYCQIAFGLLLLLPIFLHADSVRLTAQNIPLVAFAGIMASLIAPFLWIQGVMRLDASTASIFMNLTPVFTALIAIIFLHEQLHLYHLVGGVVTLLGVILAQRSHPGRRGKKIAAGNGAARDTCGDPLD
ncbi:DMT family transporter [Affinibrenneria salicis]|uniref:Threonine/homoserine exporter RhtA n=1 Tax=Affinibrenneria salicis TaxID=2590031 RepID=A0A5J5FW13_9GAMM|nr:DMT family transporter [Affinibrenneria salicis]KAA8996970.1 DMT family transporter [Affinibrenneria salicis]